MRTYPAISILAVLVFMSCAHVQGAYCTASGGGDEYIYQVLVGSINNNATFSNGYADYTVSHSTAMDPDVAYSITIVTAVNGTPNRGYSGDQVGIWVDWNADEVFSEPDEIVYKAAGYGTFVTTITPPAGTTPGSKRMRVRLTYTGAVSPCGATTYGEVEDYTIIVNPSTDCETIAIGTDTLSWDFPMFTYYHDCRTQVIYLASEIEREGIINALSLNVLTVPGQLMSNWTIRMKHTSMSSYSTPAFDADGWTVVYQASEPVGATGWRTFNFSTPFTYNGTDNLLVDFSFNNSSYTSKGTCQSSTRSGVRSAYAYSDSNNGDPLAWPTVTPPTMRSSSQVPNIRLDICDDTEGELFVKISGCVKTVEGVRIKGINVIAGTGETTVTDAYGNYELSVLKPFSGTVQCAQMDWTFSPTSRAYANVTTDQTGQDYTSSYTVAYGGGSGTSTLPYLIYTAAQLNRIGARAGDWNKYFKLMADIDLADYDGQDGRPCFNRIGYYINIGEDWSFTGNFDGNGFIISNFRFESDADDDAVGLFGNIGHYSGTATVIQNVALTNVNITGHTYIGTAALVGTMNDGTISNCSVEAGAVVTSGNTVGGLVGMMWAGTILQCSVEGVAVSGTMWNGGIAGYTGGNGGIFESRANCTISGERECGGLVGRNGTTVSQCSSAGSVTVTDQYGGGLAGENSATIEYSYSTAAVQCNGADSIGGLVGRNLETLSNCYAQGGVSGVLYVGGLVGLCWDSTVVNCYSTGVVSGISGYKGGLIGHELTGASIITGSFWDTQTSSMPTSAGGTGKTTAEMKDINTFLTAGWDFIDESVNGSLDIWYMPAGGYPNLCWASGIKYGGGTGTPEDPYLIYTAAQLAEIGSSPTDWDKHFKLMADIDMGGYTGGLALIGSYGSPFSGTFKGQGHAIRQFNYSSTVKNYAGIFEYVDGAAAQIENLTVVDSTFSAGANGTGMIVGVLKNGTVLNCRTDNCAVSGNFYVGGIAGLSYGIISSCSSKNGTVDGSSQLVGGITGRNEGTVTNSYSRCAISAGSSYAGGIAGENKGTISNCYSTGTVTVGSAVGGIVFLNTGTVTGCYWDYLTSQVFFSNGGTMKTTALMKTQSTYVGWDFSTVWAICQGTNYPRLQYEIPTADWVCPDGRGLADLNHLASWWLVSGCAAQSDCAGADLDLSGQVGLNDLAAFARYWLE